MPAHTAEFVSLATKVPVDFVIWLCLFDCIWQLSYRDGSLVWSNWRIFCLFLQLKVPAGDSVPHVCHVSTIFVCSLTQLANSVTFAEFLFSP